MPDAPDSTRRRHPGVKRPEPGLSAVEGRRGGGAAAARHECRGSGSARQECRGSGSAGAASRPAYVELRCKSNFSFLRGASHPEELVARAGELGYAAIGIADVNTLAGVVRMHCAAKSAGLKLLVGAEIWPTDGPPIGLYALNRAGYGRLARLITIGRRRAVKGECQIHVADVQENAANLIGIVHEAEAGEGSPPAGAEYREAFGDRLHLGVQLHCGSDDERRLAEARRRSRQARIPPVAVNDVHYHAPQRRFLQDVLVSIREHVPVAEAGTRLFANGERYLKSPEQMAGLFRAWPEAVRRTGEIAERCAFSLDELRYEYPPELCPAGRTPADYLAELTWAGARQRYGGTVPERVRGLIEHELVLIGQLAYEHYFLTVWDLVRFARSRGILCQGRGSAANSAVCFCLGITSVDPERIDVLFERFVSAERNEPPDIDVDFEHERREEVIQYIYDKFGRDRAGIAAEVITYRPKSAVRDVGKAVGLTLEQVDAIARKVEWWSNLRQIEDHLKAIGLDPADRLMRCFVDLCRQILGFPRHLSQHVGGFIITAGPLDEIVPIENAAMPDRTFIEWDKDDIDALGILKVDCLALGMLTAIRKCFDLVVGSGDPRGKALFAGKDATERLAAVPPEDPAVYDMACRADTVGVFQIESRAQMSMLPRLKPRSFYDLVIEVAIVRPGPIQGGMVHPYLRRRNGEEAVTFPSPQVAEVLGKTLGIPLFQEQVMRLAVVAAGFTPGQADALRRSMAAWRRSGTMEKFREEVVGGMLANGYSPEYAEQLFNQLRGFGEYGFPESHAASFALLVYVSAWLKRYYPAAFAAAVLNSQPMGFYAPAQLVRDAREHGVAVLPVEVNRSGYDCTLEEAAEGGGGRALRLGMRLVKGVSPGNCAGIGQARAAGPFRSVPDLARRSGVARAVLARLAAADAFRGLGLERREALWAVLALDQEEDQPLLAGLEPEEEKAELPRMKLAEQVVGDYETTGLSLKAHPISLIREELNRVGAWTAGRIRQAENGQQVRGAGLVLIRQRPLTAGGIVFMTVEDETGVVNVVIKPQVYERFRGVAVTATAVVVEGRVERHGEVVHIQASRLGRLAELGDPAGVRSRDFR